MMYPPFWRVLTESVNVTARGGSTRSTQRDAAVTLWQDASAMLRSFTASEFPAERLVDTKRGRTVSVVLPARNEAPTVGPIVEAIRTELIERHHVVDELVVIDDGSTDATAQRAAAAGAAVVAAAGVLPEYGDEGGKGQAMWRGLHVTNGDLVAFCDADITGFSVDFILGLVGPLLARDDIGFVKGFYRRAYRGQAGEGGRVTELMARPLISLLFPELAPLVQPLAGECAARREILETVPFAGGYGVDLALLIDIANRFGVSAFAQCDLGERVHRNRPLADLGPQATAILQLALDRAGVAGAAGAGDPWDAVLVRPGVDPYRLTLVERPPLADVPAHRKTA